jgi:hypothetical protein
MPGDAKGEGLDPPTIEDKLPLVPFDDIEVDPETPAPTVMV